MLVKVIVGILVFAVLLIVSIRVFLWVADIQPKHIGYDSGQLTACPGSPNCVSSTSAEQSEKVTPFDYLGSAQQAQQQLLEAINSLPGSTIKTRTADYVRVEFTSRLFGFVDDTEFLFDSTDQRIHVRSASRVGRSDFDANRQRVEAIRKLFQGIQNSTAQ